MSARALAIGAGMIVAIGAAALAIDRPTAPRAARDAREPALPTPVTPAFTVATPPPLRTRPAGQHWAPVRRRVVARRAPGTSAAPVAALLTTTPENTANIVLLVGRATVADGRTWVRVRLPILPNNTTGWVPRDALGGYVPIRTRLVVDVEAFAATLFRDGRPIFRAPVGVGKSASPTPKGNFYVRNRITAYASDFYGPIAFGTSARSAVLTDWPGGGFVGIHGTNRPDLLPGRVSHGCIRLRNSDILRLARLMPVGTPLVIR